MKIEAWRTDIAELGINDFTHPCHTPLDDVTEVLVVDIEVLSSDGPLRSFLELVLAMTDGPYHRYVTIMNQLK